MNELIDKRKVATENDPTDNLSSFDSLEESKEILFGERLWVKSNEYLVTKFLTIEDFKSSSVPESD